MMTQEKIHDAYVAVELKKGLLEALRSGLKASLNDRELVCEDSSAALHVSVAYGEGEVVRERLEDALSAIANQGFRARVTGFDILEGLETPFDYLVLCIDSEALGSVVDEVGECMRVREFNGGLHHHVSLLRFKKDLTPDVRIVLKELNASFGAANAIGRSFHVEGGRVCVFTPDRECCARISMIA